MAIRDRRPDAVITFGEDGLYWHLDHIGVHERTTPPCGRSAPAPPLYYVTMPQGVMREIVEAGGRQGGWRSPTSGFWSIVAGRVRRSRATPPTFVVDVRDWVPRKLAAIAATGRRWAPSIRSRGSTRRTRSRWLGVEHFRRARQTRAVRCSNSSANRSSRQLDVARYAPEPLDILRCPYCGGRLDLVDVAVSPPQRRRNPGRHSRLPLLHLPGRRRHSRSCTCSRPATTARDARRGRPPGSGAPRRCSASTTRAGGARSTQLARVRHATYRDIVEALGPNFEGGYFLYRFSDPTYVVAHARRPRRGRHGAARQRARHRHLRRLGSPDALAAAICPRRRRFWPICISRRSGWRAVHRAGLRAGLLRRQRAAAVRPRRVRLRDVHRRVHVHLDEAAVRAARWRGSSTAGSGGARRAL